MTYNSGALIVRFLFHILSTDEIAETQLSLSGGPGWDEGAAFDEYLSSDLESMYDEYVTLMGTSGMYWGSYSSFDGVKMSCVNASGTLIREPLEFAKSSPHIGTAAHVPPACSIVLSLRSGYTLTWANYGKMYLPHTILAQQSGHATATGTDTATIATAASGFLQAVNSIAHGKSNQSVVVNRSSKGTGYTKRVANVQVGNVTDTQRRRRNAIAESYSLELVPAP